MDLSTYLEKRGETKASLARRAGLLRQTVGDACAGNGVTARTALAIIQATEEEPAPWGGTVTLEDLVSDA